MSADKVYSSRDNLNAVAHNGGLAYIPFKSNTVGNPRGKSRLWRNMFYYFQMNQEGLSANELRFISKFISKAFLYRSFKYKSGKKDLIEESVIVKTRD